MTPPQAQGQASALAPGSAGVGLGWVLWEWGSGRAPGDARVWGLSVPRARALWRARDTVPAWRSARAARVEGGLNHSSVVFN